EHRFPPGQPRAKRSPFHPTTRPSLRPPPLFAFQLAAMRRRPDTGMLPGMGRRCLIVDDNAGYLTEARDLLQRQGMSIVGVAATAGRALAIAASDRPDVALVDVDLGPESGLDVARALALS